MGCCSSYRNANALNQKKCENPEQYYEGSGKKNSYSPPFLLEVQSPSVHANNGNSLSSSVALDLLQRNPTAFRTTIDVKSCFKYQDQYFDNNCI